MKNRWWPPSAVRFTKVQVLFLIRHLCLLLDGKWPSEYRVTGYYSRGKNRGHSAPYEVVICVLAELRERIERCGQDGLFLEMVYSDPDHYYSNIQHIANVLHREPEYVERMINTALRYISGKCSRWLDCPGAGKCIECAKCPKSKEHDGKLKCTKLPRKAKTYDKFKSHK